MEIIKPQETKLLKMSSSFNLFIPKEVEEKIRYMCKEIPNVEWSGVLFYTPEGNFGDEGFNIKCVDFYLMDIGTEGATDFYMSPQVIAYMTENEELLDCQMGLIHSHNTMSTFFSGTDTSTLLTEGKDRNHFVSLIVNNAGSYTAGITQLIEVKRTISEEVSFNTFEDTTVEGQKNSYEEAVKEVRWYNLEVKKEEIPEEANSLATRIKEIQQAKRTSISHPNIGGIPNNWNKTHVPYGTNWEDYGEEVEDDEVYKWGQFNKDFKNKKAWKSKEEKLPFSPKEEEDNLPSSYMTEDWQVDSSIIEHYCKQLLTGSVILPNSSKISIESWATTMTDTFDRRFGKGKTGFKSFQTWGETYVDFLVWDIRDPKLAAKYDIADICSRGADAMIERLKRLPSNRYIKEFIKMLQGYGFTE